MTFVNVNNVESATEFQLLLITRMITSSLKTHHTTFQGWTLMIFLVIINALSRLEQALMANNATWTRQTCSGVRLTLLPSHLAQLKPTSWWGSFPVAFYPLLRRQATGTTMANFIKIIVLTFLSQLCNNVSASTSVGAVIDFKSGKCTHQVDTRYLSFTIDSHHLVKGWRNFNLR